MRPDAPRERFDAWLTQHRGLLFKVVHAYGREAADREDLFQEIVLQLFTSVARYRGDCAESTWIYRVALHTAMAWRRQERRHREGRDPLGPAAEAALIEASQPRDARLDWLYAQIADLDDIDRSLMLLVLDGLSYREMSSILGISESNVGVKINRLKKRLAREAQEEDV